MKKTDDVPSKSMGLLLLGTSLGNVIVILDVTVVNVSIGSIKTTLDASVAGLQWIVSAYTLVFAALLLSGGALCDRYGARTTFIAGLTVFTLASLFCGLAGSVEMLVLARALQGVGAAVCVPASLALLSKAFPEPASRAKAISIWGGIGGLALAAGPVVGGTMVASFGWPSVFFLNLPVGLLAIWLTLRHSSKDRHHGSKGIDILGQLFAIPALAGVTFACIESGTYGWGDPRVVGGLICSALSLPIFLLIERRSKQPMLPLDLFLSKTTSAAFFVGFVMNFSYYGFLFALSLFFQDVKGYSPLLTGLTFLPMTALAVFVNLGAGTIIARLGPKPPLIAGLILTTLGYLLLTRMGEDTAYIRFVGPMLAVGVGSALSLPSFTVAVMANVPSRRGGIASGVLNACRQAGGVLGVGIFGSFVAGKSFESGMHSALLISAALVAVAGFASILFVD